MPAMDVIIHEIRQPILTRFLIAFDLCPSEGRHRQPDFVNQTTGIGRSRIECRDARLFHGWRCSICCVGGFKHCAHFRDEHFPQRD